MEVCTFALTFVSKMPEPRKTPIHFSNTRSHWRPSCNGILFLLRPEGRFLANWNAWGIEAVHCIHHGKPWIFLMWMYAIGAVQCPSNISQINAELPRGLNLTYCLIYLDDMIVFSKTEEEHLQCLHVLFNHFWEHNLKLKPTKCKFFQDDINYLAHHISKEGVSPSKENLKAVAEIAPSQTYTEIWAFLGLVGHYQWFIKGFIHTVQPLHEYLSGEGASKKSEWVMLIKEAKDAFKTPKNACLKAPALAFAKFDKPFLLETDTSRLQLGAVLPQK